MYSVCFTRVLQFEHYTEAFTLIDDVFRGCKDTLVATGFLSVIIWVFSAYGFYVLEKDNDGRVRVAAAVALGSLGPQ